MARVGEGDRQAEHEQRVTPLELFFDLVVVFAITQVTSFLSHNLRGVVSSVGRIMNPRPARSQLIGGITMGLSTALHENSVIDPQLGPS